MHPSILQKNIMKKLGLLLVGLIAVGSFSACMKGDNYDPAVQYEIEKPLIAEYAQEHLPNAVFNETWGVWYELTSIGDASQYEYKIVNNYLEYPTVRIKYSGRLLNGTQFDASTAAEGVTFSLSGLIPAWQVAFFPNQVNGEDIPGLTSHGLYPGAKIRFVTPSYLAYENRQNGSIPPNSPLDFTIEVLDVSSPSGSGN